ncbi:DNase I-like protein [Dioscorea alata]|uniref:DNase I-like protein n=1 Tax=Dioscorea alata TaxID=55571 RepID=A0ACB7UIA9_DIOAL|nr:DNase I-like protein [Dioscorea alata]
MDIYQACWKAIGGARLDQFAFLPAIGSSGGIIRKGKLLFAGSFFLFVEFKNNGHAPNQVGYNSAQNLLNDLSLYEPPLVGRNFTWTNGQTDPTWVCLDHFFVNPAWISCYPRVHQSSLPRLGSEHVSLKLKDKSKRNKRERLPYH